RIDLEAREIDGGHLVLPRQHFRQFVFFDETELDEVVSDPRAALLLLLEGARELLARDKPLTDEEIADSLDGDDGCCHCAGGGRGREGLERGTVGGAGALGTDAAPRCPRDARGARAVRRRSVSEE